MIDRSNPALGTCCYGSWFVGLDIGSSKIAVAVGACEDGGGFDVYGVGLVDTRGVHRGRVVDSDALTEAIAAAVDEAELIAGLELTEAHVGFSGSHLRGINARGAVAASRLIDYDDSQRAIKAAVDSAAIEHGREILQVIGQDFVVDGQDGITRPEGLTVASPLVAHAHIVTCDAAYAAGVMGCVARAGLKIGSTRSSLLGTSEAVLDSNERELGVAVIDIDIDVESTGIAIFERGLLRDARMVDADGSAFAKSVTLQDEAAQLFRLICDAVPDARLILNAGVVLTGGGACMSGLADIAAKVFDLPVRLGRPALVGDLARRIEGPHFTAAVGLAQLARRHNRLPPASRGRHPSLAADHGGNRPRPRRWPYML